MTRYCYPAYGRILRSEIPFPELESVPGVDHHWDFRVVRFLPDPGGKRFLGREPIYDGVSAHLYRHDSGLRIEVDDTGVFDLSPCGSRIRWRPNPDPWWDFGRGHLLGRVLATALHLAGVATLHGSAVRMRDGVVAFLAPKGFGKSTLALHLVQAGADFVTDDALPVEVLDGVPMAWPGVAMMRLEPETMGSGELLPEESQTGRDGKVCLSPEGTGVCLEEPLPLAAVYLLRPTPDVGGAAVVRAPLPGPEAVVSLLGEMKIGEMLGPSGAAVPLRVAGTIASHVPVRTLTVVRGLDRIPEVVEELTGWHGLVPSRSRPRSRPE